MMFVPQAVCKTVVPDSFKALLSQRRRWINSTIHNLLELVLVRNLCGIFCFSMQFVIFMELIGTVVLPVAILMTYYLLFTIATAHFDSLGSYLPLLMLIAVLGLPAVLILLTTRKLVYIFWMLVYLLALPVWNFVLPLYAYWHFDDFSWGETRKVDGYREGKSGDHGGDSDFFDPSTVPMRHWIEWEKWKNKNSTFLKLTVVPKRAMPEPIFDPPPLPPSGPGFSGLHKSQSAVNLRQVRTPVRFSSLRTKRIVDAPDDLYL